LCTPSRANLRAGVSAGIPAGLAVGVIAGAVGAVAGAIDAAQNAETGPALRSSLAGGVGYALLFGLLAVIAVGISVSFSRQQLDTVTPLSAFRSDVKAALGMGTVVGFAVWLAATAVGLTLAIQPNLTLDIAGVTSDYGLTELLLSAALFGLMFGLPAGLAITAWFGLRRSAAWRYGITAAILHHRKALPRRPLLFLQDAYQRGVLRQAGMAYEFRHSRLGERLRMIPNL
jgi:hypothetical protein